jgi:NADP-dependent aldehyde dehydrogenase
MTPDVDGLVAGHDPRTGRRQAPVATVSGSKDVDEIVVRAAAAAPALEEIGREGRAALLELLAERLTERRTAIIAAAEAETALGHARLHQEVVRTTYQLRLFAEMLREGSYAEVVIDHATETAMGPRPDLRRMLVPIGPVAVFAASNFPLAFSVAGGDTASALAAGCPVIVKAHPSHPATSIVVAGAVRSGLTDFGLTPDTLGLVFGIDAGVGLVRHPRVRAVAYTGSITGGRALLTAINERSEPIPFYGEMGSLNPMIVTEAAALERPTAIGRDVVDAISRSAGQLCTKPGVIFVPSGKHGDRLIGEMVEGLASADVIPLLSSDIRDAFVTTLSTLQERPDVTALAQGREQSGSGYAVTPFIVSIRAPRLEDRNARSEILTECFGPMTVVVRYDDDAELTTALDHLPGTLTAAVQIGEHENPGRLLRIVEQRAGRIIVDDVPTGVAVTWAQQHGGPWPATNSQHTSVGPTSVRRFLRPLAWQNTPERLLPDELHDNVAEIPRRVDGVLELATPYEQPPKADRPTTTDRTRHDIS